MSCIEPLAPAVNSYVQPGAAPGFLPQKPLLQVPDGHLQPMYLCPFLLSVPGMAGRVQASVRTGICSTKTSMGCQMKTLPTSPPLLGGLEQITPVV